MTPELGRVMVLIGVVLVLVGGAAWLGIRIPGDITIQGERGGIFIPLGTMILVSIALTILANLLIR
jgi:hypothetical protein